nr:putative ribonuclease H-like domain-containing protein [Tanacetum cinerariifolium]
ETKLTLLIIKNLRVAMLPLKEAVEDNWHHFIRDTYEKKLIQVLKIHTDDNVADLLTNDFDVSSKELASPKQTDLELMDLCTHLSNKVLEIESEVIDIKSSSKERIGKLEGRVAKLEEENRVLKELHSVYSKADTAAPVADKEKSFKWGRIIVEVDEDDVDEEEPAEVKEVLEVVKAARLMTEVVTTAEATTNAEAPKVSILRRRRGVIIQDPKETTSIVVKHLKVQSKDKGKGMTYSEIRPLFEKHFNYNQDFLEEVNEEVILREKEVEVEAHKREGKSLEKEVTKKQKMDEEAEDLKSHLQIVDDDDDDVYTEATTLASIIPVVDYKIHFERNKCYFKIIRANGNHMLFLSFSTMLKNFDREDLKTLEACQRKRDQKGRYGLAKVKSWKLFESVGVHCITFLTTQMFLLVEKRYPLTHFTLEKMLNNVRLEVEEVSEMSLELLRLVKRQLIKGNVPA